MANPISGGTVNVWFDAADPSTITVAAGTGLSTQWNDKSGGAHNATATTTARPTIGARLLNGLPVLDFDGAANTMRTASVSQATATTWAIVFSNDDGANGVQQDVLGDVTNGQVIVKTTGNAYQLFNGGGSAIAGKVDTSPHFLIVCGSSTGTGIINVDGVDLTLTATPGSGAWAGGMQIGASGTPSAFWNGAIAEIITYTQVLTLAQRTELSRYFYNKWFARSIVPMQATLLAPKPPVLLPTERFVRPPTTAALGAITGTLATTNANDTSAAAGTTTVTGALARTNANDTLAASGSVGSPVSGTLATTNANDTSVGAGTTKILGTSSTINANDTLSATGTGNTNAVVTTPPAQQVGGTFSGRRGPYTAVDAELEAILRDDEEILVLL